MSLKLDGIIVYILVAVIIIIIVHLLYKKRNENLFIIRTTESTNNKNNDNTNIDENMQKLTIRTKYPDFKFVDYDEPHIYDPPSKTGKCAVPTPDEDFDFEQVTKNLFGEHETCHTIKSRKQFNDDFFRFRDLVYNNSSERFDPVDKMADLKLDGNLGQTHRKENMKIKDLYDSITSETDLYKKSCYRLPTFDSINFDGYYMSDGAHPIQITADLWKYPNEKVMNGGDIRPGLHGRIPPMDPPMDYHKN